MNELFKIAWKGKKAWKEMGKSIETCALRIHIVSAQKKSILSELAISNRQKVYKTGGKSNSFV